MSKYYKAIFPNKLWTPGTGTIEIIGINKIWIFEIQDGISGGIIIADSEDEARKKLSLDREIEIGNIARIYPLSDLDLNKDVHDLW